MSGGNVLGLYTPKQQLTATNAPYLRAKDAEKWIKELPLAHIGESSRLIFKALVESNRVDIPANQRFKLLEMLREPLEKVVDALTKYYIGQPFPITLKNQKIADLARELNWEMAIGYKIVLESAMSGFSQRVDAKSVVISIHRTIYYLSQAVIKAYQVYKNAPERAWLEIHHLYLFADHNKFQNEIIKDPLKKRPTSISSIYKQILLLAVANPFRLPQREIDKVYALLQDWVEHVQIRSFDHQNSVPGLFVINMEKDRPPSYFDGKIDTESRAYFRVVDTSSLTRILRDQLDSVNREADNNDHIVQHLENRLHHETLRRLLLVWGAIPRRNFSRQGKNVEAKICFGLNSTHYFIEQTILAAEKDSPAIRAQHEVLSQAGFTQKANFIRDEDTDRLVIPWEHGDKRSSPSQYGAIDLPFATDSTDDSEQNVNYEQYNCMLVNQSAGGFCLNWKNQITTKTAVGTLVGVHYPEKDNESTLTVGVIRWLRTDDHPNIFFGVEILAPYAQPVIVKNISRKHDSAPFMRSLLLPEIRAINQPQTLITPPLYRVGDRLRVDVAGQIVKVKLTKLLESAPTFSQFQFSILKSSEIVSETDKLDRIKNFDSLWSAI